MQTIMLCRCWRVLDRDQVVADPVEHAERGHRLAGVVEQRFFERRIAPGLGDDAGADMRADFGLVGLDQRVDGGGIEIALLGQHGFERADAQLHLGQFGAVVVRAVVVRALVVRALVVRALVVRALVVRALVVRALVVRALVVRALVVRALVVIVVMVVLVVIVCHGVFPRPLFGRVGSQRIRPRVMLW